MKINTTTPIDAGCTVYWKVPEALYLLECGEPWRQTATRLNVKPPSLARLLARHGYPIPRGGWVK